MSFKIELTTTTTGKPKTEPEISPAGGTDTNLDEITVDEAGLAVARIEEEADIANDGFNKDGTQTDDVDLAKTYSAKIGNLTKTYEELQAIVAGGATPEPTPEPEFSFPLPTRWRGYAIPEFSGAFGFDSFPSHLMFGVSGGADIYATKRLRFGVGAFAGVPFSFGDGPSTTLSPQEAAAAYRPEVNTNVGPNGQPELFVSGVTGGVRNFSTGPLGFDLELRFDVMFEIWKYFNAGLYSGIGVFGVTESTSTTIHRTSGDKYHSEHYGTGTDVPGDQFGSGNGGAAIPAPAQAQPGVDNDVKMDSDDFVWRPVVRGGVQLEFPVFGEDGGLGSIMVRGGVVNIGGDTGGEVATGWGFKWGGPSKAYLESMERRAKEAWDEKFSKKPTPPPATPDIGVDGTTGGDYDGALTPTP